MGQPNKNSQNNLQEQACSEYWWANEWEDQNYKVISVSPRTKSIPALEEKKKPTILGLTTPTPPGSSASSIFLQKNSSLSISFNA